MDNTKNVKLFKSVFDQIVENKRLREEGKDICIPFPFPRFSEEIPGIIRGRYYICTANSKVGKTKFTDAMFLYGPYRFVKETTTNIKVKILYFTLEMSKEDKVKEALAYFLYILKDIRKSPDDLDSLFKKRITDNATIKAIQEIQPQMCEFLQTVDFIDHTRNPFGIYKAIREYAHNNGHYVDDKGNKLNTEFIEKGLNDEAKKIFQYIPNDPDEYVICIFDHLSLLTPEDGKSTHQTLSDFSSNYCIRIRDRWKYIPVGVQQQAAAQESVENTQANMIRPSANGLGDNKLTGRDCNMMLGLFAPFRFRRAEWEGFDITKLRDSYRELSVILNRNGGVGVTDLYFDGAVNYFKELPEAKDMTSELYSQLQSRNIKRK